MMDKIFEDSSKNIDANFQPASNLASAGADALNTQMGLSLYVTFRTVAAWRAGKPKQAWTFLRLAMRDLDRPHDDNVPIELHPARLSILRCKLDFASDRYWESNGLGPNHDADAHHLRNDDAPVLVGDSLRRSEDTAPSESELLLAHLP